MLARLWGHGPPLVPLVGMQSAVFVHFKCDGHIPPTLQRCNVSIRCVDVCKASAFLCQVPVPCRLPEVPLVKIAACNVCTPSRGLESRARTSPNAGEGVGQRECPRLSGGGAKWEIVRWFLTRQNVGLSNCATCSFLFIQRS